jgi:PIN domain nuclease of toxin-antitoxin system
VAKVRGSSEVSRFVTDTHPLIWHLTKSAQLSKDTQNIFADTDAGLHQILLPGIVLIEMVYLTEKGIVPTPMLYQILNLLDTPDGSYAVAPLEQGVARTMAQYVPWSTIPELADRIITATALSLNLPLITRDKRIQESKLVSIFW